MEVDEATLLTKSQKIFEDSNDIDEVIKFLRLKTDSKVVSIKLVSELLGATISEAKMVVHDSAVWHDVKNYHEELHEELFAALENGEAAGDADNQ